MSRAVELKNKIFDLEPTLCADRAFWLTESHRETEGEAIILRRAKAFKKVLENMKIYIADGELIVGNMASAPRSAPIFPEFGIKWLEKELDWLPTRPLEPFNVPDNVRNLVGDLVTYWSGKTHEDYARNLLKESLPEEYKYAFNWDSYSMNQAIYCSAHMSTGDGHIIANYGRIMREGLQKTIDEANGHINAINAGSIDVEKKLFYKAVIIVCEALINFAHRFAAEAERLAEITADKTRKSELLKIAEVCNHVPQYPAGNFREAIQTYWFIHLGIQLESNGHSISLGRFDQNLYPFYAQDLEQGAITREEALELIECFFVKTNELIKVREWGYTQFMSGFAMFQTLTLAGVDAYGNDVVNDISYLTLEATKNLKLPMPTTIIRLNEKNSDEFLAFASKALVGHGGGLPAFFNDAVGIPILQDLGTTEEEARDWAVVGCCEPVVPSKFITLTGGVCHVNLLKIFEIALNNGRNPETGFTLHPGKGGLESFTCLENALQAYKDQLDFYLQFPPIMDNVTCKTYEMLTPTPFLSMLIDNRMESGKDISCGRDDHTYHNLLIEAHGSINVGNSLAVIKKLVFEEGKLTTAELKKLLDTNFEGIYGERMRNLLENAAPKYGNDEDYVDLLVKDTIKFYIDGITRYTPGRGGKYGPSTQSISCNVPMGAVVGATPDGRKAGVAVADNTSPMVGTDLNGPTAVVKSAGKIGQRAITNGTILNMKFHPSALQDEERIRKFCNLIRTYFSLGGYQVQFNVVSQEMLKEAKAHPEEYKTLVVKVAGYSALFSSLDERLQDQIIERTSHVF